MGAVTLIHAKLSVDAVAIRHTQAGHAIQCGTFDSRFSLLAVRLPSVQMIAKDGFEAKHGCFSQ